MLRAQFYNVHAVGMSEAAPPGRGISKCVFCVCTMNNGNKSNLQSTLSCHHLLFLRDFPDLHHLPSSARVWYKFQNMPPALKPKREHKRDQVPSQDGAFGTKICYPHLFSERHNEPAGGSPTGLGDQRNHCNLNSRFPFYALSAYSSQFPLSQSS